MEKLGMTFVRSFRVTSADQFASATFISDGTALFPGQDVEYSIDRHHWLSLQPRPLEPRA